jgi:hypothetical protein
MSERFFYGLFMIPIASLTKASRFYVLTRCGSSVLHARECHFDKFDAKNGTCRVSDYGFKRIKLSFETTIEAIAKKAFATREDAALKLSSLTESDE